VENTDERENCRNNGRAPFVLPSSFLPFPPSFCTLVVTSSCPSFPPPSLLTPSLTPSLASIHLPNSPSSPRSFLLPPRPPFLLHPSDLPFLLSWFFIPFPVVACSCCVFFSVLLCSVLSWSGLVWFVLVCLCFSFLFLSVSVRRVAALAALHTVLPVLQLFLSSAVQ
jgi:hypothetical protein